ncbi:MAG: PAS domain S-box protein [Nitrososphaeria archaeon]
MGLYDNHSILIEHLVSYIDDLEKVSEIVLKTAKDCTRSNHGFIGIIDPTTKALLIKTFGSLEYLMTEKIPTLYLNEKGLYPSLFGFALNEKKAFYTNDPSKHPALKGLPENHIKIERFLAVPVMLKDKILGLIALANSQKEYTEDDLEKVKGIGKYFALALERYWFEEELRASKAYYEILFDNSPLPKIVVEENDIISKVNKAFEEQTGYTRDEVVGKIKWQKLVHEEDVERMAEYKKMRLAGGPAPIKYETRGVWKDGSVHNIIVYSRIVPGARRILASWIDITREKRLFEEVESQRKQLEEYAYNLERMVEEKVKELHEKEMLATIGQMTLMVAHDLRNPLQAVSNYMFLLNEALKSVPNEVMERVAIYVRAIDRNLAYMDKIIKDLQNLGKREAKLETVNLQAIVEEALKHVPKQENIKIISYSDNIQAQLDPTLIVRALSNLILNSIQAMPDGGTVTVQAKLKNDVIEFNVIDTGMGMDEEVKRNMFKLFYTTKAKGMGLGLPVVKHAVELHEGTIEVESEPNKGTKITIKIPYKQKFV